MKIAVMASSVSREATVPDSFEQSPAVLIVETDTWEIEDSLSADPMDHVQKIIDSRCEAVVCSGHIGNDCFNPIADASITRYEGAGLNVMEASVLADRNRLSIIPEYEGGPGCSAGTGTCEEDGCGVSD